MDLSVIGDALSDFHPVLKTEISPKDYEDAAGRSASSSSCSSEASFSSHQRPCTADEVRAKLRRTQQPPRSTAADAEDRLYAAAEKGDAALVRALLETSDCSTIIKGSRPFSMKTGAAICRKNPLVAACSTGQISVVEELVKAGFDVNVTNEIGRTCLHQACQGGHVKVAELLLDFTNELVDAADREGFTASHVCALNGEVQCLRALYDRGASMEVKDKDGRRPSHLAAMRNHRPVLEFLYDIDCDLRCSDDRGRLPVHLAAQHGAIGSLVCLVERDCNAILSDKRGLLAIHYAASGNHLQCVKFLVDQGTSVNVAQLQGKTSVILAAEHSATDVLHWLLEKGAKLNDQDVDGDTALHRSAASGHGPAFNCLISHGADTTIVNSKGENPFEVAKKHGHPVLMENATVGKVRCPACVVKEKHEDWHLAHPMSRVIKEVNSLASRVYAYPESLQRTTMSKGKQTTAPKRSSQTRLSSSYSQSKGRIDSVKDSNQQTSTRSLAARYFGEHLLD